MAEGASAEKAVREIRRKTRPEAVHAFLHAAEILPHPLRARRRAKRAQTAGDLPLALQHA
jgi:hypothetical protein